MTKSCICLLLRMTKSKTIKYCIIEGYKPINNVNFSSDPSTLFGCTVSIISKPCVPFLQTCAHLICGRSRGVVLLVARAEGVSALAGGEQRDAGDVDHHRHGLGRRAHRDLTHKRPLTLRTRRGTVQGRERDIVPLSPYGRGGGG